MERNRRPIRIAIDIAIWQFQNQAGQGGQNPALRTFYYRLLRILALPIHPLFVYDGPKKPLAKRNKVVSRYETTSPHNEMSKKLLQLFRFPYQTAPGEAEAECALLQREGVVDAVMSQDVDAVMWGSTMTIRDWSQEGTRSNKTATHVNVLRAEETKNTTGLDPDGMILVAMLSGGDYAPEGMSGFGPGLACEIARADFGSDLLKAMSKAEKAELAEWKVRLQYELDTNYSGYFKTKHKSVKIPAEFPDETLLRYYTHPEVSTPTELQRLKGELLAEWDGDIDATELREHVARTFNWQYRGGACKFIRSLAPALLAQRLLRGQEKTTISSNDAILERRMHFVNDGMPELRIAAVPADIVGLNIEDEEDNPEYVQAMEEAAAAKEEVDSLADAVEPEEESLETTSSTSKPRKKAPWDPRNQEKMWLPETIVKLGLPRLVEEWEQEQRDMLTNPKKFIANKARKINPSNAAKQNVGSIHTYFATTKPTVAGKPALARSPKKVSTDPVDPQGDRNIRASSTPTRRKARPKTTEAMPATISSMNPFSLASQVNPQTKHKDSTLPPSLIKEPSANASKPNNPIRRKCAPIQKSKTLPASFDEPILISSSPAPPPSPPQCLRSTTPPPPHFKPQTMETAHGPVSDTDSLPSPSQLLNPTKPKTPSRRQRTLSAIPTSKSRQAKSARLSEIFAPRPRTTIAVTDSIDSKEHRKEKKMVLLRDSLPGTWREVVDGASDGAGGAEKGKLSRVSLVDLTDS